jgi:hypothetical protein
MLRCDECRATVETFELGWVSFYARVPDEDPAPILMTYCGRCARRECGSLLSWLTEPTPSAQASHGSNPPDDH